MSEPKPNRFKSAVLWWAQLYNNAIIKCVVDAFFLLPAATVLAYVSIDRVRPWVTELLGQSAVQWLDTNGLWIFLAAAAVNYVFGNLLPYIATQFSVNGDLATIESSLTLLNAFQTIVEQKCARFEAALKPMLNKTHRLDEKGVFSAITQPEQQIAFIVHTLQACLESIARGPQMDVRLVEVQDKQPVEWYAFAPPNRPPQTAIDDLKHSDTALMNCVKSQKIVVIEDLAKESRKPIDRRYRMIDQDEQGSVVCYPVYHHGSKTYPFVITIRASKPGFFNPKSRQFYKWLLEQFAHRIRLEYSLAQLKSEARQNV